METIFEAARDLQDYCDDHGWHSCFIGGIAVQRWGEVRVTCDADLTLLTSFGAEAPYVETLQPVQRPQTLNASSTPCPSTPARTGYRTTGWPVAAVSSSWFIARLIRSLRTTLLFSG